MRLIHYAATVGLLAGLSVLVGAGGCGAMRQLFDKTLLDPSQPIFDDPHSAMIGIRPEISLIDQPVIAAPKDAADPVPEDLVVQYQDYRLASNDTIIVTVYDLMAVGDDRPLTRRISDRGYVTLPKVVPVCLAGLTEREAELAIAKAYRDAGVLGEDPQVAVSAQTRVNRTFSTAGAFNRLDTFNIPTVDFRLLQALGQAGGTISQTNKFIYVIRMEAPAEGLPVAPPPQGLPPGPGEQPAIPPLELPGGPERPGTPAGPPSSGGEGPATAPLPALLSDGPEGTAPPERPAPSGAGIGRDLENWSPQGIPGPNRGYNQPPTGQGGPPQNERGAGGPATAPAGVASGHWMLVDGKWTLVAPPLQAGPGGPAAASPQPPRVRIIRIDLEQLRAGVPRYNILIRDKDTLVAPQPIVGEFYVVGNIARPGVYSLTDRQMTLTRAIAAAGGLGPLAVPQRVQLIRQISADQQQMVVIDYARIIEGKAEDYLLKPYDMINVGTSVYAPFLAVLRNAFRATAGVGFVYDRNFADIDSFGSRNNPHNK